MLDPADMEPLVAMGFFAGSNALLNWLQRQNLTAAEAERWAKATMIVYGKFLTKLPVGMGIHALITFGMLTSKPKVTRNMKQVEVKVERAA